MSGECRNFLYDVSTPNFFQSTASTTTLSSFTEKYVNYDENCNGYLFVFSLILLLLFILIIIILIYYKNNVKRMYLRISSPMQDLINLV